MVIHGDNEYYLDHNLNNEYQKEGSVFLDYRIKPNKAKKTLVYGHSSSILNAPFNNLMNYLNKEYFDNHKKIIMLTSNYLNIYETYGIAIYENNYDYLNINFKNNEEYLNNIDSFYRKSLNKTFMPNKNDETIYFQTCNQNKKGSFIVLGAKLIKKMAI